MATTMYSGDTLSIPVTVQDSGVNVESLAGATINLNIINRATGAAVITKDIDDASVSGAVATFTLSAANTASLDGEYIVETEVTDTSGNKRSAQDTLIVYRDYIV